MYETTTLINYAQSLFQESKKPETGLYHNGDNLTVYVKLAGISKDQVNAEIIDNRYVSLEILKPPDLDDKLLELPVGKYTYRLADSNLEFYTYKGMTAEVNNGILFLNFPKKKKKKTKINIK